MDDEQAATLARARRWCDERGAVVRWDEAEATCLIRVPGPRGGTLEGKGPGYFEAYVECRVRYDAAVPADPPSWF